MTKFIIFDSNSFYFTVCRVPRLSDAVLDSHILPRTALVVEFLPPLPLDQSSPQAFIHPSCAVHKENNSQQTYKSKTMNKHEELSLKWQNSDIFFLLLCIISSTWCPFFQPPVWVCLQDANPMLLWVEPSISTLLLLIRSPHPYTQMWSKTRINTTGEEKEKQESLNLLHPPSPYPWSVMLVVLCASVHPNRQEMTKRHTVHTLFSILTSSWIRKEAGIGGGEGKDAEKK